MCTETCLYITDSLSHTTYVETNDASDTALIEKNGVTPKWVATPFLNNSIVLMRAVSLASLVSTYVVCERLSVMHKQVSVHIPQTVNFVSKFSRKPLSESEC